MARALCIIGGSYRHHQNSLNLTRYIRKTVGISELKIIEGAYKNASTVREEMETFLAHDRMSPTLVFFSGHGSRDAWILNEDESLLHGDIVTVLQGSTAVLIIADCCHAYTLADKLAPLREVGQSLGLVAACDEEEVSYIGLVSDLVEYWRKKNYYPESVDVTDDAIYCGVVYSFAPKERIVRLDFKYHPSTSPWMNSERVKVILEYQDERRDTSETYSKIAAVQHVRKRWGDKLDHFFFSQEQENNEALGERTSR